MEQLQHRRRARIAAGVVAILVPSMFGGTARAGVITRKARPRPSRRRRGERPSIRSMARLPKGRSHAAQLAKANVRVKAFDPVVRSVPPAYRDQIEIVDGPEDLARGSDALVVVTEWPEFRDLDLGRLGRQMRTPLLLDGRNLFDPAAATSAGLAYVGVGRGGSTTRRRTPPVRPGSDGGSAGGRSSASDDRVMVEEASDVA